MKFTKMSLVAALLIGSSAFAIDNVKVSGDAKLYYTTDDSVKGKSDSLFSVGNSAGQAALGLGITADLTKSVSAGAHLTALSTLGLEGQLVGNVWEGTNGLTESFWFDEAWIAATLGKTTAKIGRMELDTPLVFTENWSIAKNTFSAAVLVNQDIPDTTLVGAYVGQSSGVDADMRTPFVGIANRIGSTGSGYISTGVTTTGTPFSGPNGDSTPFHQFYNGAFAAGLINNTVKPLTVQAWYYDATHAARAYWLQADVDMEGILLGAQYTDMTLEKELLNNMGVAVNDDLSNDAYALMLGYTLKDVAKFKVAYSQTGKASYQGNPAEIGSAFNLATAGATAQSKLYTEAWWNYGYVTRADTTAINVTIEGNVSGIELGAYYTQANVDKNGNVTQSARGYQDMQEFTLTAGKDFGPLNATVAYIYTQADDQNTKDKNGINFNADGKGKAFNTVQAYLTLNF